MSRKHVVKYHSMSNLPAGSAQVSSETNVENLDSCSYHVKFASAASGTFKVQARNADLKTTDTTAWYDVNFGTPLTISSETDVQILLNQLPFKEVRLVWTPSSASGLMNAYLVMKTVGA